MNEPASAAPEHPRRSPSITRVFTVAFLAIAVAVLADRYVTWQSARRTQADMVDLTHRLEQLELQHPTLGLDAALQQLRELAADVGDDAIQTAIQTTVILTIVLVALAVGLWYNRRRLAGPFARIVLALERVATGSHAARLDESQPEEFGMIARSVNQMAASLAWRERMQERIARLLTALNAPAGGGGRGGAGGAGFRPTLAGAAAGGRSASGSAAPRVPERRAHHVERQARGAASRGLPAQRGAGSGGQAQGSVPRQRLARAPHAIEQRDRIQRAAADRSGRGRRAERHAARLPRDDLAQRPAPAAAHQRAARSVEDRRRPHGSPPRGGAARRAAARSRGQRARAARGAAPPTRPRAGARARERQGRPGPRAPDPAQPAVERHQVHARWRPRDADRPGRGRRAPRPRRRARHRDRHRARGPGEVVSGIRAARRRAEPSLRRNRAGARALQTARRAARRRHRRGERAPARLYRFGYAAPGPSP